MCVVSRISALREVLPEWRLFALSVGESAYVAPFALLITPQRQCLLRADAPSHCTPDTTFSVHVRRTTDGYVADITYCTYHWTPADPLDDVQYLPVKHIVSGDEFLQSR